MTAARLARGQTEAIQRQRQRLGAADPRHLSDFEVWSGIEQCLSEASSWAAGLPSLRRVAMSGVDCRLFTPDALQPRSALAAALVDLDALGRLACREPIVVRWLASERPAAERRRALAGTAFLAALDRFLDRHRYRGACERDWARSGFGENPSPVIAAVRRRVDGGPRCDDDVETRLARRRAEAADAWLAQGAGVAAWRRWAARTRARRAVHAVREHVQTREHLAGQVASVMAALRDWHLALADRFLERGWLRRRDDYFRLHLSEIAPVICGSRPGPVLARVAESRLGEPGLGANQGFELPPAGDDAPTHAPRDWPGEPDAGELRGLPLAAGSVEGAVAVVRDPADVGRMRVGGILVAPAIDASWLPVLSLAAGLVLETGGFLSQGALIARECGLPALGRVAAATARLRTGDPIRLDATGGRAALAAQCGEHRRYGNI